MANHLLLLHPQHRVAVLLLLAFLLPLSPPLTVTLFHLVLLLFCWRVATLADWWRTLLRLKWLMISLVILYGWFTPGLPIWELQGVNMPSRNGLLQAAYRAMLLSALVAAVMWLIKPLTVDVLATSLSRLLTVLRRVGVNTAPLVRRLALSIHAVTRLQEQLKQADKASWLETAGAVLLMTEQGEFEFPVATEDDVDVPTLNSPSLRQQVLFGLVLFGLLLSYIFPRYFS